LIFTCSEQQTIMDTSTAKKHRTIQIGIKLLVILFRHLKSEHNDGCFKSITGINIALAIRHADARTFQIHR
jgi:hypothetical protein